MSDLRSFAASSGTWSALFTCGWRLRYCTLGLRLRILPAFLAPRSELRTSETSPWMRHPKLLWQYSETQRFWRPALLSWFTTYFCYTSFLRRRANNDYMDPSFCSVFRSPVVYPRLLCLFHLHTHTFCIRHSPGLFFSQGRSPSGAGLLV